MDFSWLSFENPVTYWWLFLVFVSGINITAWFWTRFYLKSKYSNYFKTRLLVWLSFFYVFGCALRSFFPKADVQRICLFDTWFSSVFFGRSVATVAELCFVVQWSIVLYTYSNFARYKITKIVALIIVPLIVIAEIFSWYAVITTNYFGNMVEESLWATTYTLIAIALINLYKHLAVVLKYSTLIAIAGCILYVGFMVMVDVPMYFHRWQIDLQSGKEFLGFYQGILDLNNRWLVTYEIKEWKDEIPWMSLYFSVAVWVSLLLCYVPTRILIKKK